MYFTIVPFFVHLATYWTSSAFFLCLDIMYLDKEHPNWNKYMDAVKISFINQFTIGLPTLFLLENQLIAATEKSIDDTTMVTIIKIFLIVNLSNLFFYWCHRLLHTRNLYNMIHYKHHEFIEPIAVAALYAHPIEHLFANTLAFIIPFILIGTTYNIMLCLISAGTFITTLGHAMYENGSHLVHHRLYKYNFGFGGYLDMLFNTYKN
jgi:sterol desaturase/sphingolipid hydroxylase (fatty acid hydroxylase superfamily)